MYRTIQWFEDNFKIDPIDIIDIKDWNPYALNEGLVDYDDYVELSLIEISRLSPLECSEIERLLKLSSDE